MYYQYVIIFKNSLFHQDYMTIFTKWRALQTCAADRPGRPQTRLLTLARRAPCRLIYPGHIQMFVAKTSYSRTVEKIIFTKLSLWIIRLHYSGGKRKHLKGSKKKTCRQNGDCLWCYYGNCQSNCKVPDVAMTTKDNVNLGHNLSVNTMAPQPNSPLF